MPMYKLDDSSARQFPEVPVCLDCVHWEVGEDTCKAFPKRIPDAIWLRGNKHTQPFRGDHGIRFEAKEKGREE